MLLLTSVPSFLPQNLTLTSPIQQSHQLTEVDWPSSPRPAFSPLPFYAFPPSWILRTICFKWEQYNHTPFLICRIYGPVASKYPDPASHEFLYQLIFHSIESHYSWSCQFHFLREAYRVWISHPMTTLSLNLLVPMTCTGILVLSALAESK